MTPLALRFLVVPVVAAGLILGLVLVAGTVAPGYWWSIGLGVAWFVLASFALGRLTKRRPDLRLFVRVAFVGTVAAVSVGFWWTSVRETTVHEDVAIGTPASALTPARGGRGAGERAGRARRGNVQLAAGPVESLAHSGKGRAAVVRLARGGRVLTLREFDIDPGP